MAEVDTVHSRAELQRTPGVAAERDAATRGFTFQQTMLRVKDPERSLDFYTRVLGMTLIAKLPFPTMEFTLYFLAYCGDPASDVPDDPQDRIERCMGRCAPPARYVRTCGTSRTGGAVCRWQAVCAHGRMHECDAGCCTARGACDRWLQSPS